MKSLIIYTSQTGFTKRYATWLHEEIGGEILELKSAKKQKKDYFASFDTIIFGGWAKASSVVNAKWFFKKSKSWHDKKLILFCVGASPMDNPDIVQFKEAVIPKEDKTFIKFFYCSGGLNYAKMGWSSKLLLKMFTTMLKRSKDEKNRKIAEMLSHSY
ncbi:MAG TPA: flavodoxin domain-containing protein, partial [Bacilli bacterium]|nr:flavodoxin domain-containing protein [Bacilli bacterium]